MKKNVCFIWALLVGFCLLTSCSDDDENSLPQTPLKIQKIIGHAVSKGTSGEVFHITANYEATYGKDGRLQTLQDRRTGEEGNELNEFYDLQRGVMSNPATGEERGTIEMDAQGRITALKIWKGEGAGRRLRTAQAFTYNAEGFLETVEGYDTSAETETPARRTRYEYQNGTAVRVADAFLISGQWDEEVETVEYTQTPNRNHLFMDKTMTLCIFVNAGLMGKCPYAYLPKKESDAEEDVYQLDDDGNVRRYIVAFGTPDEPPYFHSEEEFHYVGLD